MSKKTNLYRNLAGSTAPNCTSKLNWSQLSQPSTIFPAPIRCTLMPLTLTRLPEEGIPRNVAACVRVRVQRAMTLSSGSIVSWILGLNI